jgi:LuxR family maltose regulon positive regulatory protein
LTWAHDELLSAGNRHGALRVGLELSNAHFLAGNRIRAFEVLSQIVSWAAKAGIVSFLLERQSEFNQLLSAAKRDALGIDPEVQAFLQHLGISDAVQNGTISDSTGARSSKEALTAREQSIIKFIADGQSNKQIARTLGVTPETIKTHVKRIFIKLSAESRAQAVVRAQSLGFLRNIPAH